MPREKRQPRTKIGEAFAIVEIVVSIATIAKYEMVNMML